MQKREVHCALGALGGHRGGARRIPEVQDRLGHAPEHEPDAHAGREQHGEPAQARELRPRARAAYPDMPEAADGKIDAEQQKALHGEDEKPAETPRDAVLERVERRLRRIQVCECQHDEQQDESRRYAEDPWVQSELCPASLLYDECFLVHVAPVVEFFLVGSSMLFGFGNDWREWDESDHRAPNFAPGAGAGPIRRLRRGFRERSGSRRKAVGARSSAPGDIQVMHRAGLRNLR
jgi:hypothetical protein